MRSLIAKILIVTILCIAGVKTGTAQTMTNPSEGILIGASESALHEEQAKQTENKLMTDALMLEYARVYMQLDKYEKEKNRYLSNAEGFAKQLKSTTVIASEFVGIILALVDLKNAVAKHPDGVISTTFMTNVYVEVVAECIGIYNIFNESVGTGGDLNMLSGKDRTEILWRLEDSLKGLKRKLNKLSTCVRYYKLTDVLDYVTSGLLYSPDDISKKAAERWSRAAGAVHETYDLQYKEGGKDSFKKIK